MKPTPIRDVPPPTAPRPVVNPAGADQLAARVGTHDSFLAAMLTRLTSVDYPRLAELRTRRPDDPAIALLDAWATAADVLAFYTERVVNEAFLRTARERRSLVELAALVGHRPGPGVAANTFLAFGLEKGVLQTAVETLIPAGTAVKSVPTGNELPQTFETSDALPARGEWNALRPRMSLPQVLRENALVGLENLFLEGTDSPVKPTDQIVIVPGVGLPSIRRVVQEVRYDRKLNRTELVLGESKFSIKRIRREVDGPLARVLTPAADATANLPFPWLRDIILKKLGLIVNGDTLHPEIPRLTEWQRLSQFDQYLTPWRSSVDTSVGPNPVTTLHAKQAADALTDDGSEYKVVGTKLRTATEADGKKLVLAVDTLAANLPKYDDTALAYVTAGYEKKPNVQDDMKNAFNALKDKPVPGDDLPQHKAVLKAFFDLVTTFKDAPSGDVNALVVTRDAIKKYWGIRGTNTTPPIELNTAASNIHDRFVELDSKIPDDPVYPFSDPITPAIDKAINDPWPASHATNGPTAERIIELLEGLTTPRKAYFDVVDAVAKTALTVTNPIVNELAAVVQEKLLKPISDAIAAGSPSVKTVHDLAVANGPKIGPAAQSVAAASDWIAKWDGIIDARRELFKTEAKVILADFIAPLGSNPDEPWKALGDTLSAARDKTKRLDEIMEAIAKPNGHLEQFEKLTSPDPVVVAQITGLIRKLKGFVALDGGAGVALDPKPPSTDGGGLPNVAKPSLPGVDPQPPTRLAGEVLDIQTGNAKDILAQLSVAFSKTDPEELRARWSAVVYGKPSSTAALLSQPLQLFGHSAPRQIFKKDDLSILDPLLPPPPPPPVVADWTAVVEDYKGRVVLNVEMPSLATPCDIYLRIQGVPEEKDKRIVNAVIESRSDYGLTQKVTRCDLADSTDNWTDDFGLPAKTDIGRLRTTLAIVPIRNLPLAELPLRIPIGADAEESALPADTKFAAETDQIELDGIYLGLRPGHLVIVEGERVGLPGVIGREVRRIKLAQHTLRDLPGDRVHTRIFLNARLDFTYVRESVKIHANVVPATHGETVREVLGSGDAARPFQRFLLRRAPLTHLPAPTPAGVRSTLAVRANDLLWHERDTLLDAGPDDRVYSTGRDDAGNTTVAFGDGRTGRRLPTGRENVRAEYRIGLGKVGNVRGGALSQLAHRPLGVKEVTNPLPATGGADPDTPELIRANAPVGLLALDRLVSVDDYAHFARNYAGIDKAVARRVFVGAQPTVHVTYAGIDDIPLDDSSELIVNLHRALLDLGDPLVDVRLARRELLVLILSAGVGLEPDYEWKSVEPKVRAALYDGLGFARRQLAQPAYLSDVQRIVQRVPGVRFVDVDAFGAVAEDQFKAALEDKSGKAGEKLQELFKTILNQVDAPPPPLVRVLGARVEDGVPKPAQLAVLSPDVTDSLFLREVTP